jgi:hypothetical protein
MTDQRTRFKDSRRNADLDHHDSGRSDRSRGRRVHGDAQGAVVGGGFSLMDVRNLNDREEGQKEKAQNSHDRQSC